MSLPNAFAPELDAAPTPALAALASALPTVCAASPQVFAQLSSSEIDACDEVCQLIDSISRKLADLDERFFDTTDDIDLDRLAPNRVCVVDDRNHASDQDFPAFREEVDLPWPWAGSLDLVEVVARPLMAFRPVSIGVLPSVTLFQSWVKLLLSLFYRVGEILRVVLHVLEGRGDCRPPAAAARS